MVTIVNLDVNKGHGKCDHYNHGGNTSGGHTSHFWQCADSSMWSQAPKYIHDFLGALLKVISKLQIGKVNFLNCISA